MLDSVSTTMGDVHNNLRKLIAPHTILIGHSLDCDLRALHLIHLKVIDTAALFPHVKGSPFKQALKKLALDHLGKVVQADSGSTGHDSVQGNELPLFDIKYSNQFSISNTFTYFQCILLFNSSLLCFTLFFFFILIFITSPPHSS